MYLLSILIPVYKVENYIRRCLDSILKQTVGREKVCEIIMVDDGSPDRSGEICDEYAKKFVNFSSYHKINEGTGVARNYLLDKANGKYVWFVDSDDTIQSNAIDSLLNIISNNDGVDIITFCLQRYYEDGKYFGAKISKTFGVVDGTTYLSSKDFDGFMCNKSYNLSFLRNHNLRFNENMICLEDSLFNIKACVYASSIYISKNILYNYFQGNPNSTLTNKSVKASEKKIHDNLVSQDELLKICDAQENSTIKTAVYRLLNKQVCGFFYALLLRKTDIHLLKNIIQSERKKGLYPLSMTDNVKMNMFVLLINFEPLYLSACRFYNFVLKIK